MATWLRPSMRSLSVSLGVLAVFTAGCAGTSGKVPVHLSGRHEVPIVVTGAAGRVDITVDWFKCPSPETSSSCPTLMGTVTTTGMTGTRAEIRQGAAGRNGPVIATLVKTGNNVWEVPPDTTLTPAQYSAYLAGQLYVTVESAAHKGGEIRAQL